MTLDATKPDGTTFLSDYASYQRETREAVNTLEALSITSDPTLDAMVKVASWLDMVGMDC